ncbi:unnamed protein product [Urochloa humidicola]
MAWLFSRTTASSILLVLAVIVATAITSLAAAAEPKQELFPEQARPTLSGYLNVRDRNDNSLYFAFYEANDTDHPITDQTPLLVWFQGGPGCSSLIGNFEEIGPYILNGTSLVDNPYRWNRRFGVIFIDNPLGTGFSVPKSVKHIPRDQPTIAAQLLAALQSFMDRDDQGFFRRRPLFLAGESYAGKYIPAAASHILDANDHFPADRMLRLEGIAIGNGMTDPVEQVTVHASQAYFAGLINAEQRQYVEAMQKETVRHCKDHAWQSARGRRNDILNFLKEATGVATLFNYARAKGNPLRPLVDLLNTPEARAALRVRDDDERPWVRCRTDDVGKALHEDIMQSVRGDVEDVLKWRGGGVRVLLFQGVYDLHLGPASVEAWVRRLDWERRDAFLAAKRTVWKPWGDDGALAGYVQAHEPLTNVVVVGAGHMAAGDNRPATQAMIEGWVLRDGPFRGGADGHTATS